MHQGNNYALSSKVHWGSLEVVRIWLRHYPYTTFQNCLLPNSFSLTARLFHSAYIFLSTTASIGQFYLVAIVRRPIPLLMQTVQVPCHIGHATIRTDRPILAVTMTIAIGSLLSIMISSIVRINRISRRFGRTPRTQKVKKRFITKFMSSCNQVASIWERKGCRAWNSTVTTTEWMRFSGGLLALEEGEEWCISLK